MYVPPHFREHDVAVLRAAIAEHPLATLVTASAAGVAANHLPMLFEPEPAPNGTLVFHVARANPVWHTPLAGEALAIFSGPNAYVSPSAYPTKRATGKVVPTWNYVAVHAYGALETFDDRDALHALVSRLTGRHEADREAPWNVDDAPAAFVDGQLRGIIGIRMPLTRIIGKWKMSQNRPEDDRRGVVDALSGSQRDGDRETARIVADRSRPLDGR